MTRRGLIVVAVLATAVAAAKRPDRLAAVRADNRRAGLAALKAHKLTLLPPRAPIAERSGFEGGGDGPSVEVGSETKVGERRAIAGAIWGTYTGGADLFVRDAKGAVHLLELQSAPPRPRATVRVAVPSCGVCVAETLATSWWLDESQVGCYQGGPAPPPATQRLYALAEGETVGPPIIINHAFTTVVARPTGPPCPPRP